eukprot:Protomagalhaensia_sp_Gyna_25__2020@NODE_2084_length_1301_cov_26_509509_g1721_i0_p2_GENE_NODE_2084_length_1301_cov_26_509509_g1721_i0NODE_2084_length_1301_cov_26_509509_g1721_i0_p2_ORF_typecomplete_len130_score5_61_NODE_2084_length_1301_cov_26_509509_g1721_i08281217
MARLAVRTSVTKSNQFDREPTTSTLSSDGSSMRDELCRQAEDEGLIVVPERRTPPSQSTRAQDDVTSRGSAELPRARPVVSPSRYPARRSVCRLVNRISESPTAPIIHDDLCGEIIHRITRPLVRHRSR